ncbi:uncharacterized protein LOC116305923 [Actinia tenebrosa]|uniref:Uncharacterized protein LOC116305923 n=1 Tax=Actinia tenebrosa TaxID=6105 RepID=A0A6P8J260_ACTTE|nr:uncharacterized protein LOC116305923 [Actinia tenebrosa]
MAFLKLSSRSTGIARPLVELVRFQSTTTTATTQDVESSNVRPFEEVPGPKGLPFFGSFYRYIQGGGFHKMFNVQKELFKEYGPIFKETLFGRTGVHVMDPKDCEKVFRNEGKYPHRTVIEPWLRYREERGYYHGIAQMQGKEWHRIRKALAPKMMRPKQLYDNIENFYGVVDDSMVSIRKARGNGKTSGEVPTLDQELFKFATESIGTMVFDARIGLYEDPPKEEPQRFIQSVHDLFHYTQQIMFGFENYLFKYFDTPSWKKLCKAQDIAIEIGQKYVDKKIAELKEKLDNPEELLEENVVPVLTYLLAKKELTPHEINISSIEMFMGGVDTTSNTALWLLYNLARNPEAQERLYEEIVSVTGKDGYLTAKNMGRISYLKACLKESMRVNPVVIGNARFLDEDIVLSGYNIPAKTLIQPSIYAVAHSEEHFADAGEFRPERWLRETGDDFHAFSHLPFGFGPRMCIGRRVAELEIYLFVSKFIQQFRLEYHREPVEPQMQILIIPEETIVLNLVDRNIYKCRLATSCQPTFTVKFHNVNLKTIKRFVLKLRRQKDMAFLKLSSRSGIARPMVKLVRFQSTTTTATTQDVESSNVRPFEDIPGPKGLPFFGSVHRYIQGGGFHKMFNVQKELFKEYGPIFKETLFGRTGVHVMDPKDCEKVFRSEGKYPYRIPLESWLRYRKEKGYHPGILLMQGKEWHRNRKALSSKMLRPKQLYDNIDNFYGVVDDSMASIRKARGEGKTSGEIPALDREMFKFATESVGTMVFDARIGLYEDPPREEPQRFIKSVHDFLYSTQLLEVGFEKIFYKYFDTPGWKTMRQSQDAIVEIGQKYVDMKIAELNDKLDDPEELLDGKVVPLLTYLLAKKELTPHEINMSAIEMFMAGVDTTSNTALWLLYSLARNPEAQERLYEEIVSVTGKDGYLTAKDMGRISYLKACLKESMRLHPVVIANARILDEDIILSGFNVPAKTLIQPAIYVAGHSEQLFERPEEFRPGRWLRETGDDINAFSHLPFGFGPRMCIGRRVAELEIFLFLSKLVQQFRLEYHREPVASHMKLLIIPEDPIIINFVDRNA